MTLATSAWRESLGRSVFSQLSMARTSGAVCSSRHARRSSAVLPLMERSWAKITSIWADCLDGKRCRWHGAGAGEIGELKELPPGMGPTGGRSRTSKPGTGQQPSPVRRQSVTWGISSACSVKNLMPERRRRRGGRGCSKGVVARTVAERRFLAGIRLSTPSLFAAEAVVGLAVVAGIGDELVERQDGVGRGCQRHQVGEVAARPWPNPLRHQDLRPGPQRQSPF